MKVRCAHCDLMIPDTHPTCGEGWDLCETCRAGIVDSVCQDIPLYCQHCKSPLDDKDYVGAYTLVGDFMHNPGEYWVFQCGKCRAWNRCHKSTEHSFAEAIAEVKEQRESLAK